ncbi:MAG: c-type cytochrome [Gammaproteobacteria bacterium]
MNSYSRFNTRLLCGLLLAASILWGTTTVQAAGPDHIHMLANMCSVCHGTGGRGAGRIPKLNGELEIQKFVDTMHGFVSGNEKATVMDRIAKGLSDDEIKALAEYFAALEQ